MPPNNFSRKHIEPVAGPGRRLVFALLLALLALSLNACFSWLGRPLPARTPTVLVAQADRPAIAISPDRGSAGVYVQVVGEGWPAHSLVLVTLRDEVGRSGILAASTAETNGRIATGFLYPISQRWLSPGAHTVLAYTADGNLQATAEFAVAAPDGSTVSAETATPTSTNTATAPATPTVIAGASPTATPTGIPTVTPTPTPTPPAITDWRGEYWNNSTLSGDPVLVRNDVAIFFDWGAGGPAPDIDSDHFSARWRRELDFDAGLYRFRLEMDEGARLLIDDTLVLDEWQPGPARAVSIEYPLSAGRHILRVEFFERSGDALIRFWWERQEVFTGWKGEYYANRFLQGSPALVRDDPVIDFNWGAGSPGSGLPVDDFSARWQRAVTLGAGRYRFFGRADDGIRFWLDGELLIDEWQDGADRTVSVELDVPGGDHGLRVEYYEHSGGARAGFWWERAPQSTVTFTPTWTPSWTPTPKPSATPTPTFTWTPSPTATPFPLATTLPTASPTASPTATATPATETPTVTATPTVVAAGGADEGVPLPVRTVELPLLPRPSTRTYAVITSEMEWRAFLKTLLPGKPVDSSGRSPIQNRSGQQGHQPGGGASEPTDAAGRTQRAGPQPVIDFADEVLFLVLLERGAPVALVAIDAVQWNPASHTLVVRVRFADRGQPVPSPVDGGAAVAVRRTDLPHGAEVRVVFVDEQAKTLHRTALQLP